MGYKPLFIAAFVSLFIIILIGTTAFGFSSGISVTGNVVSIDMSKTVPLGFNIAGFFVVLLIATYVIARVNREES